MPTVPLVDGKLNYQGADLEDVRRNVLILKASRLGIKRVPELTEIATTGQVRAQVRQNILCAQCPDCNGAELVWRNGPYLMLCNSCWNAKLGGKWRQVIIPDNLEYIIAALERRPMPQNRNFWKDETLEDLMRENEEHASELLD
jgi:hypothetical protein